MSLYSSLKSHNSRAPDKLPMPPKGKDVVFNPDNTPRNVEGSANRVFDCGSPDGGYFNAPKSLVYHGAAIEGVPKTAPTCQGTVANIEYSYVSGGVTVQIKTTISLKDLQAYRNFVNTDGNIDPMRKAEVLEKLNTLQSHMENGIPAKAGAPAVDGMYKFYDREKNKYPEARRDPLNGHVDRDGRFVRSTPNGAVPPSVDLEPVAGKIPNSASYNPKARDPRMGKIPPSITSLKLSGDHHPHQKAEVKEGAAIAKKPPSASQGMAVN